jgi:hypothetical protein
MRKSPKFYWELVVVCLKSKSKQMYPVCLCANVLHRIETRKKACSILLPCRYDVLGRAIAMLRRELEEVEQ